jgi:hypothetical protein
MKRKCLLSYFKRTLKTTESSFAIFRTDASFSRYLSLINVAIDFHVTSMHIMSLLKMLYILVITKRNCQRIQVFDVAEQPQMHTMLSVKRFGLIIARLGYNTT